MKLEELQALPLFQTKSIAAAAEDPETLEYIMECLGRFFAGDFGTVPADDTAANLADLEAGGGHVLARYKAVRGGGPNDRKRKGYGPIRPNCSA